ncbi:MAG: glycosyltransferase [Bacteroidota bacterium]
MTIALAILMGAYAVTLGTLAWGIRRSPPIALLPDDELPHAAIVVAARDEEAAIGGCLDALSAQDYPAHRLTIVVADDHSTDGTAAIVRQRAREQPEESPAVRYVRVPDPVGDLRGKAQALHTAIESVEAEVILVTDADCAPVATWARAMASTFADERVGVTCAIARIMPRPGRWFDQIQTHDWSTWLGVVAGSAELGAPPTGMGNNMAVRRSAYDSIGGYPALPFSVTEDFSLIRAIAESPAWELRFPADAHATVHTLPAEGIAGTFRQRRRWAQGGVSGGAWVLALYAAVFVAHALPLAALAMAPAAAAGAWAVKTLADGALLAQVLRRQGERPRAWALLGMEAFATLYVVTLPIVMVLRPTVRWKGRDHGGGASGDPRRNVTR